MSVSTPDSEYHGARKPPLKKVGSLYGTMGIPYDAGITMPAPKAANAEAARTSAGEQALKCYVRYPHKAWMEARPHQKAAFEKYLGEMKKGMLITVKHGHIGDFEARFSVPVPMQATFTTEYGETAEIILTSLAPSN